MIQRDLSLLIIFAWLFSLLVVSLQPAEGAIHSIVETATNRAWDKKLDQGQNLSITIKGHGIDFANAVVVSDARIVASIKKKEGLLQGLTMGQIIVELTAPANASVKAYDLKIIIPPSSVYYPTGGTETVRFEVVAATTAVDNRPEFVIVAIGDSYGSGEGNPSRPGRHYVEGLAPGLPYNNETEFWGGDSDSQRCHRSDRSAFAKAAAELQSLYPQVKIVFKSFACSGAAIIDSPSIIAAGGRLEFKSFAKSTLTGELVFKGPKQAGGALVAHKGSEGREPPLPPQLTQINNWIGSKRIDALLMSFGGNDLGFASIIVQCLVKIIFGCDGLGPAKVIVRDGMAELPGRYDLLGAAIRGEATAPVRLRTNPSRVYITTYPDPSRDENGALCDRKMPIDKPLGQDVLLLSLSRTETSWLHSTLVPGLNAAVESAALRNGWTAVRGIADDYRQHGICSNARWINTNRDGLFKQGADQFPLPPFSSGFVHPNDPGYNAISRRLVEAVRPQLSGFVAPRRIAPADGMRR